MKIWWKALALGALLALPAKAEDPNLETAESFMQEYNLSLRGPLYCYLLENGQWIDAFRTSNGDALLRVAREPRIYILIHGFYWKLESFPDTGVPTLDYALGRWQEHLNLIRSLNRRAAACLVVLDSTDGFGDHERGLGGFLTALRWMTDSPGFYDPQRTISFVGYSAGGNFAKSAYLQFLDNWSLLHGATEKGYRPTRTDFVFLCTPHWGTNIVPLVNLGGDLLDLIQAGAGTREPQSYYERAERDFEEKRRAEMRRIHTSPGARQLLPNSVELMELNRRFLSAAAGQSRIFNLYSPTDIIAGPEATLLRTMPGASMDWLKMVEDIRLDGLGHTDFVSRSGLATHQSVFRRIYGPPS